MLETIFEWLIAGFTEVIEAVVTFFMYCLHFDIRYIAAQFPILGQTYSVFRTIGIGLAVIFASLSIIKSTLGPMSESKESPMQVLFRLAISIGLIFFGGYGIEAVINVVKLPYSYIFGMDAVQFHFPVTDVVANFATYSVANAATGGVFGAVAVPVVALGAGAMLIISAIMLVIVFVNMMKLIVEVAQRIMWLFVILYTAPLAFSTFASKTTSEILRKWLMMFFSQCLLLILSVWILNVALSGFSVSDASLAGHNFILQFLMTLAACKIGANLDREIQRIGLNPTTANGNVFDEVASAFRQFGETATTLSGGGTKEAHVLGKESAPAAGTVASAASSPSSKPYIPTADIPKADATKGGTTKTDTTNTVDANIPKPDSPSHQSKIRQSKVAEVFSTAKTEAEKGMRAAAGGGPGAAAAAVLHTAHKTYDAFRKPAQSAVDVQSGPSYVQPEREGGHMSFTASEHVESGPHAGKAAPGGQASYKDISFSEQAQQNGAHLAYSPIANGTVISADTPEKIAAIWANSINTPGAEPGAAPGAVPGTTPGAAPGAVPGAVPGATPRPAPGTVPGATPRTMPGAQSVEYSRILNNTAKAMPKAGAVEAFSNPNLQSFETKGRDAYGVGHAFNQAVKGSGVQTPASYQNISTQRNQQTGAVVSKANFIGQDGRGMRTDLVNNKAYSNMPAAEKAKFQAVPGAEGKLFVRSTTDNSRQVAAMQKLNMGGPQDRGEMQAVVKDAYSEALKGVDAKDIRNVEITPSADGAGAKVSFVTRTNEADGRTVTKKMEFYNGAEPGAEYNFKEIFGQEDAANFGSFEDSEGKASISFAQGPVTEVKDSGRKSNGGRDGNMNSSNRPPSKGRGRNNNYPPQKNSAAERTGSRTPSRS